MKLHSLMAAWLISVSMLSTCVYAATPEEDDAKIRAGIKANLGKATITLLDAIEGGGDQGSR